MNHRLSRFGFTLALTGCCAALSGCGNVRQSLGLDPTPPDEFTIMQTAPLTLPPEYGLRPPLKGDVKKEGAATKTVTQSLEHLTPAERQLLTKAGADNADPAIKATIESETKITSDQTLTDRILNKRPQDKVAKGDVLDAEAEAKRLKTKK